MRILGLLKRLMDKYSKGGGHELMAPKKGYKFAFKDTATVRDQHGQFCNRTGCSGRIKYNQNTKIGNTDKAKQSQTKFRSSNGNDITRGSSRDIPVMVSAKKSLLDSKRKLSSQFDTSDSSVSSESGGTESPSSKSPTSYQSVSMKSSGRFTVTEAGNSNSLLNVGPKKIVHNKSGSHKRNSLSASNVPKSSEPGPFSNKGSRYGMRNLKCNSISDIVPPSCSLSKTNSIGKSVMKKRSQESESSLSQRGRKTPAPSSSGISISDLRRNSYASGEGNSVAASVRNRRPMNTNMMRLSCLQNGNNSSNGISQTPDNEIPFNVGGRSSLPLFSPSSSGSSSYSLSSSNGDDPYRIMPSVAGEPGFANLVNRDTLHRHNLDGIAEILLALESIEQNEELNHEQLLALETSLFLNSLNIYDQHTDMRLDIDNMSYEELLALEERMGSVSTALPEEALPSCLKRETYQGAPSEIRITESGEDGDDMKCSICQEEYVVGDEMGRLVQCRHGFHETCINQWLRLKNWCPICKSSAAAPSQESSSS